MKTNWVIQLANNYIECCFYDSNTGCAGRELLLVEAGELD